MSVWRMTLIMDEQGVPWTSDQMEAIVDLGLIDPEFDTFESDAFVIGSREAETFGRAVGEAIDPTRPESAHAAK